METERSSQHMIKMILNYYHINKLMGKSKGKLQYAQEKKLAKCEIS